MGNLQMPICSKLFERYGNDYYQVAACSMQGFRSTMEDAHLISLELNRHKEYALFGIFDGHNGEKAAQYVAEKLSETIDNLEDITNNELIKEKISNLDKLFCQTAYRNHGTTVVFALVKAIVRQNNNNQNPDNNLNNNNSKNNNENEFDENIISKTQNNNNEVDCNQKIPLNDDVNDNNKINGNDNDGAGNENYNGTNECKEKSSRFQSITEITFEKEKICDQKSLYLDKNNNICDLNHKESVVIEQPTTLPSPSTPINNYFQQNSTPNQPIKNFDININITTENLDVSQEKDATNNNISNKDNSNNNKNEDQDNLSTSQNGICMPPIENEIEYEVRVFWAGDSRCIWIPQETKNSIPFQCVTNDHKPQNPGEKERIFNAGGFISCNRVDSRLAVSRAFGDASLKNDTSRPFNQQRVIADCEYSTFVAKKGDSLLLFCDGLIETLNNEKLISYFKKAIVSYEDPAYSLGYLFDDIIESGSKDNMSCILIQLKNGKHYADYQKKRTYLPGPLYIARNDKNFLKAYLQHAKTYGHYDGPQLRLAAYREDIKYLQKYNNECNANKKHLFCNDSCNHQKLHKWTLIEEIQNIIQQIELQYNSDKIKQQLKLNNNKMSTDKPNGNSNNNHNKNDDLSNNENRNYNNHNDNNNGNLKVLQNSNLKDEYDKEFSVTPPLSENETERYTPHIEENDYDEDQLNSKRNYSFLFNQNGNNHSENHDNKKNNNNDNINNNNSQTRYEELFDNECLTSTLSLSFNDHTLSSANKKRRLNDDRCINIHASVHNNCALSPQ